MSSPSIRISLRDEARVTTPTEGQHPGPRGPGIVLPDHGGIEQRRRDHAVELGLLLARGLDQAGDQHAKGEPEQGIDERRECRRRQHRHPVAARDLPDIVQEPPVDGPPRQHQQERRYSRDRDQRGESAEAQDHRGQHCAANDAANNRPRPGP